MDTVVRKRENAMRGRVSKGSRTCSPNQAETEEGARVTMTELEKPSSAVQASWTQCWGKALCHHC